MTISHTEPVEAPREASACDDTDLLAPVCVACVGDRTNPEGGPCLRCKGAGLDPDPLAPAGIPVAS
jgi:hypothetical protein